MQEHFKKAHIAAEKIASNLTPAQRKQEINNWVQSILLALKAGK